MGPDIGLLEQVVNEVGGWAESKPVILKRIKVNNLIEAWAVAARIFPREAQEIGQSFTASVLPPKKWPDELCNSVERVRYYLVRKGDHPVGFTGLTKLVDDRKCAWVDWVGVSPDYRMQGISREIIHATITKAIEKGYGTIRLWTTNDELVEKLYEPAGFVRQSIPFMQDKLPIQICSRSLALEENDLPEPYKLREGEPLHIFCGVKGIRRLDS